jgi:hypothetical protein
MDKTQTFGHVFLLEGAKCCGSIFLSDRGEYYQCSCGKNYEKTDVEDGKLKKTHSFVVALRKAVS